MSIILLLLTAAVSALMGFMVGKQQTVIQPAVRPTETPAQITAIPTTPLPSPTQTPAAPTAASTTQPSAVQRLNYALPPGWQTIRDTSNSFEIGYNPDMSQVFASTTPYTGNSVNDLAIHLAGVWQSNPVRKTGYNIDIFLAPYNGGSRHVFILENPSFWEKMPGYHEKEYLYNGWNCLVLYKIALSQSNTTNGMCAVSSKRAFRFSFSTWTDEEAEKIIGTIKLLK